MSGVPDVPGIRITMMIAADSAQAVDGKLYVLGGGFNHLVVSEFPAAHTFDVAMMVDVPWTETNRPYEVVVELVDADGQPMGYRAEATLETGRPAGARPGSAFAVPLAVPVTADFPEPGRYVLRGEVDGKESHRVVVEVVPTNA
jgi:hypothetical protein